jgi:hypothetical protein
LTHCRRKDNPKECKGGFPKRVLAQLLAKVVVLCRGLAQQLDLAISGRRNQTGSLFPPRNDEWINGTHPALLAALRCNSDVQLPYRFPITWETHADDVCNRGCVTDDVDEDIILGAQAAQDAQAGCA